MDQLKYDATKKYREWLVETIRFDYIENSRVTVDKIKKDPFTYEPWMEALMSVMGQRCVWNEKSYLNPLIQYIVD